VVAAVFTLLADDHQAKINVASVRQAALNCGIADVIQNAQIRFRSNATLQDMCSTILELLMQTYS
jgi:hypothetical protein